MHSIVFKLRQCVVSTVIALHQIYKAVDGFSSTYCLFTQEQTSLLVLGHCGVGCTSGRVKTAVETVEWSGGRQIDGKGTFQGPPPLTIEWEQGQGATVHPVDTEYLKPHPSPRPPPHPPP